MPHKCSFGCKTSDAVMHVFPNPNKYPDRFKEWVSLVRGDVQTLSNDEIYRKKRICDRHFPDHLRNRNNRLNALAVPSVNLPDNLNTYGTQNGSITSSPFVDHSQPLCSNTSLTVALDESQSPITSADLFNDHNYHLRSEPPQINNIASNALDGSSVVDDIPSLACPVYREEYPDIKLNELDDPVPAMSELKSENALEIMYEGNNNTQDNEEYNFDNEAEHTSNSKYALDEVDTLFISYAASFRKLSTKLQSMLKLDLAKLFARYEMNNLIQDKSVSRDKENTYKTNLADKNITKRVTKEFVKQTERIIETPEEAKLKRPASPPEPAGPATSRDEATSIESDNPKSAISKFRKFPKTYHQCTSDKTQNHTPSHFIKLEFDDKSLNISPLIDADKYFSDWEQVSNDDPIVEKVMLPLYWSAKDAIIISEDDVPG